MQRAKRLNPKENDYEGFCGYRVKSSASSYLQRKTCSQMLLDCCSLHPCNKRPPSYASFQLLKKKTQGNPPPLSLWHSQPTYYIALWEVWQTQTIIWTPFYSFYPLRDFTRSQTLILWKISSTLTFQTRGWGVRGWGEFKNHWNICSDTHGVHELYLFSISAVLLWK